MAQAIATDSFRAWVLASRPKTLGAITCPILIGSSLAFVANNFAWHLFFLTLSSAVLLQILANIVNDYCDFIKGADTDERLGPPRAMQMGYISKFAMKRGMLVVFLSAISLGLFLVYRGGWPVLIVGLLSTILCVWYTAGPKPLAYLGFAEISILIFFGPLPVLGAFFVQTLELSLVGLLASLGPAFLSTALIMTNNLRDVVEDKKNRKKTIAVRFGEKLSRNAIVFLVLAASISPLILWGFFSFKPIILLPLAALVIPAKKFSMILFEPITKRFNLMLAAIGKCLYLYGILMSMGIIYGAA